jgi:hypothetical protein
MALAAGLAVQLRYAAVAVLLLAASAAAQSQSVTQHHKQPTRAGFYTYSALAGKSVAKTKRIPFIATPLNGQVYAQLLYYSKVRAILWAVAHKASVPVCTCMTIATALQMLPCHAEDPHCMLWLPCSPGRQTSSSLQRRRTTSPPCTLAPARCCMTGCWRRRWSRRSCPAATSGRPTVSQVSGNRRAPAAAVQLLAADSFLGVPTCICRKNHSCRPCCAGTPIIDDATNSLYVAAMSTPDGGKTTQQVCTYSNLYRHIVYY